MDDALVEAKKELLEEKQIHVNLDSIMDDPEYLIGDKFFSIPHANDCWKKSPKRVYHGLDSLQENVAELMNQHYGT